MYYVSIMLNLCFLTLVFLFPQNVFSQTFLIGSGTPVGGSGDIAANVLMAQYLQKLIPDSSIVIYVTPESIETISSLTPEVREYPIDQINFLKNGILYISPGKFIPNGSQMPIFHFSFSNLPSYPTKNYFTNNKNVPVALSFSEYQGKELSGRKIDHVYVEKNIYIPATGLRFSGLYISPNGESLFLDNDIDLLNKQEIASIQEAKKSKYIVYLYSRNFDLMSSYVKEIIKKVGGDSITIFAPPPFIKHLKWNSDVITNGNVKLFSNFVSFEMTRKMMKISNLPLLVTGDVSLSLAIEYRKPFVYSVYSWKEDFARDLRYLFPTAKVVFEDDRNYFEHFILEDYGNSFYSLFDLHRSSLSLPDKIKALTRTNNHKTMLENMKIGHFPFMPTNEIRNLLNFQSACDNCERSLAQPEIQKTCRDAIAKAG
jgi:hypothetical protein